MTIRDEFKIWLEDYEFDGDERMVAWRAWQDATALLATKIEKIVAAMEAQVNAGTPIKPISVAYWAEQLTRACAANGE